MTTIRLFERYLSVRVGPCIIAGMTLLGVSDIHVPWETLLLSVLLYVVLPLAEVSVMLSLVALANRTRH